MSLCVLTNTNTQSGCSRHFRNVDDAHAPWGISFANESNAEGGLAPSQNVTSLQWAWSAWRVCINMNGATVVWENIRWRAYISYRLMEKKQSISSLCMQNFSGNVKMQSKIHICCRVNVKWFTSKCTQRTKLFFFRVRSWRGKVKYRDNEITDYNLYKVYSNLPHQKSSWMVFMVQNVQSHFL